MQVQSLGWEDPLEESMVTHSSILGSTQGFPDSSVGKESACKAGDPSSIPEPDRLEKEQAREEINCPIQYSGTSLVAQLVKNLPAMRETWVGSLG